MNIQLVESLANAIQALPPEERALLNEKLAQPSDWPSFRAKILAHAQAIQQRRGDRPLGVDIDAIIHQMREERDEQLMTGLSPGEEAS
jgi:hypothetical protein